MTDFYTGLAATTARLLEQFGPAEGFTCRHTTGRFDKVRGGMTSHTTREQIVKGVRVVANDTNVSQLDRTLNEQTLVPAEVVMLKVAAAGLDFELDLGQEIVVDGSARMIVGLSLVKPADVPLLYTVAVRR